MRGNAVPLERSFSLYLDVLRFLAAAAVVISHLRYRFINPAISAAIPDLGRESVIIFFVLSGFVIACTVAQKRPSLYEYALARCARIYSVVIPILLLTFLLAFLTVMWKGAEIENGYELFRSYFYLPFHLLFLGEIWTLSETPPWLGQYWSLGYEIWYYIFFGAVYFLRGKTRLVAATLIFCLIGYKLWLLLPIWLAGVAMYHAQQRYTLPRSIARLGWLLSILLLFAYKAEGLDVYLRQLGTQWWPFASLRLGSASRYLADYLVCLIVLGNFYCARFAAFEKLIGVRNLIRALSAYSFTLYLVHGLVMGMWETYYRHDKSSALDFTLLVATIALVTWLFGLVTEEKKHVFYNAFKALSLVAGKLNKARRKGPKPTMTGPAGP